MSSPQREEAWKESNGSDKSQRWTFGRRGLNARRHGKRAMVLSGGSETLDTPVHRPGAICALCTSVAQ
ncbi:MAG: hypothetical protein KatS3mg058_2079 [Roseiflexus sp.]|nr:MAG: hypothetical protein KatS3mg058_2079 [Roseiflexus sp.]